MRNIIRKRGSKIGALFFLFLALSISVTAQAGFSKKALSLKVKKSEESITLSWNGRRELTGYQVYRTNASGRNRVKIKTTKKTRVTVTDLKQGKTYYFCVRGYQKKNGKTKYTSYSKIMKVKMPVRGQKSTLKKLLQTALQPVGSTMYVWGGGWNEADTGAGREARTIGVSPKWKQFFQKQTSAYDYRKTRYQIANGLDCSGYIGWCIYNIQNTENGKTGYVMLADQMAENFASRGWGTYTQKGKVKNYRAGDIMSSSGHVYLVVGQCSDGSVVLLHSSPPGVQLAGTPDRNGKSESKAVKLARKYMKKYYPEWYRKYPNCAKGSSYLTQFSQMRWDLSGDAVMTDPEKYRNKTAEQILRDLYST